MICIFTHVIENPQHRLLADDQKYKNNIAILSVFNSINSKHANKVMAHMGSGLKSSRWKYYEGSVPF